MKEISRHHPFPSTRWTLIARISGGDPAEREAALAEVCALYWPPVYAFIRSQGHPPHDAEDLTQGFFATFLKRDHFSGRTRESGRLRSYVLSSVKHFLVSEARMAKRQKRGGGSRPLSLDAGEGEARCQTVEATDLRSPDLLFERQWAATLLENALLRLQENYRAKGKEPLFARLRPFLRTDEAPSPPCEIAAELGLSAAALRIALHRLRLKYQQCLLEEVTATLEEGEDPEEEVRYLRSLFF